MSARVVLGTVLLTWTVLLGLDVMLSLVNEFGNVGKGGYGFSQAVAYMAYTVPPARLHAVSNVGRDRRADGTGAAGTRLRVGCLCARSDCRGDDIVLRSPARSRC